MNRVVRQHYPVAKLPDDLKAGFSDDQQVTLIIEAAADKAVPTEEQDRSVSPTDKVA